MRYRYPDVPGDELPEDDVCAICRENMEIAKRLPCSHVFHLGLLLCVLFCS